MDWRLFVLLVVGLVSASGCDTPGSSTPEAVPLNETAALEQVDTLEIQETDERFIGTLTDLDVRLDPFRLYIADRETHRVALVSAEGKIEKFIGIPGQGPGELQNPVHVLATEDRIVVNQARSRGFSVFNISGLHVDTHRLPEEYSYGGFYDFYSDGKGGYLLPLTGIDPQDTRTLQASPEEATIARLNGEFKVVETFGSFPPLYQEGDYIARQRTLDVTSDSLAAVSYSLVPDVQVYDLNQPDIPKVKLVPFAPPNFEKPDEEIPWSLARESPDAARKALSQVSTVRNTYLLDDGTIVQNYANQTLAYYQNRFDKSEETHYAVLGRLDSDQRIALKLPGAIRARDAKDRLYIELKHEPDNRKIGIYEVNWP